MTKREKEVIKDLYQGLSRTEIATSQDISVNTVKMVIYKICDKLHVNSVDDMIRKASELEII